MTLQNELTYALLSMDAYNRGYDAGINTLSSANGTQIGNITIKASIVDNNSTAINAGFYALAYDLDGDSTADVISYRGTDYPRVDPFRDISYGWTLGAGLLSSEQAHMAVEFYQAVTGPGNHFTAGITLTGHSLGGGLAGFVGELYNTDAFIYDSMTYDLAAERATNYVIDYLDENDAPGSIVATPAQFSSFAADHPDWTLTGWEYENPAFVDLVYGGNTPIDPSHDGINGYYVEGELLEGLTRYNDGDYSNSNSKIDALNGLDLVRNTGSAIIDELNEATARHSQATLVIAMFADEVPALTHWDAAAEYFWPLLYNDAFARSLGIDEDNEVVAGELREQAHYADILRTILAYSALDEGTLVFGDTGIWSLYDDADNLGAALEISGVSSRITANAADLAQEFVRYAGLLALNKIDHTQDAGAAEGVLAYENGTLSLDLSEAKWAALSGSFDTEYLAYTSTRSFLSGPDATPILLDIAAVTGEAVYTRAERIVFAGAESLTGTISESASAADKTVLFIAGEGDDTITADGTNLFLWSAGGNDTLTGSAGADYLYGGDGNDTLNGAAGDDVLVGGLGSDTYIISEGIDYISETYSYDSRFESDRDVLDFSGVTGGVTFAPWSPDLGGYNYVFKNNAGKGTLSRATTPTSYGFEEIILTSAEDGIYINGAPGFTGYGSGVLIDAGGDDDVVHIIGGSAFITAEGLHIDNTLIINHETIDITEAHQSDRLVITHLGSSVTSSDDQFPSVDYGAFGESLSFSITPTSSTVTDGSATDTFSNPNAEPIHFIGSDNGDTFSIETDGYNIDLITTGKGDDSISLLANNDYETTLQIIKGFYPFYGPEDGIIPIIEYTGGDDIYHTDAYFDLSFPTGITWNDLSVSAGNSRHYEQIDYDIEGNPYYEWLFDLVDITINVGELGEISLPDVAFGYYDSDSGISVDNLFPLELHFYDGTSVNYWWSLFTGTPYDPGLLNLIGQPNPPTPNPTIGTYSDDTVTLTEANSYSGYFGDDEIHGNSFSNNIDGGTGNDLIFGDDGSDTLLGQAGNDTIEAGSADDDVTGGDGNDILYDGAGNDTVNGSRGNDTLYDDLGNDILTGGEGDDVLYSVAGSNQLFDGEGDDTFHLSKTAFSTLYDDNGVNNIIWIDAASTDLAFDYVNNVLDVYNSASYFGSMIAQIQSPSSIFSMVFTDTSISMSSILQNAQDYQGATNSDNSFDFSEALSSSTVDLLAGDDSYVSSAYGDNVIGGAGDDYLVGGAGNDVFNGGNGDDTLDGGAGHDTLTDSNGYNIINGGDGNDTISAGSSNGIAHGGAGNDAISGSGIIYGDDGDDTVTGSGSLYGGTGHDIMTGYSGEVFGDSGDDTLTATSSAAILYGGAGNDTLFGSGGSLYGEDGDDIIYAGSGYGSASGGSGNDFIYSGSGNPFLKGESDDDRFVIQTSANHVEIFDLFDSGDRLDLTAFESIRSIDDLVFTEDNIGYNGLLITPVDTELEFSLKLDFHNIDSVPYVQFRFYGAPDAYDDLLAISSGGPAVLDVLANDEDTSEDPLHVHNVVVDPLYAFGTTIINEDGTITYTPRDGFTGRDFFQYTIINDDNITDTAYVTLTVLNPGGQLIEAYDPDSIISGGFGDDFIYDYAWNNTLQGLGGDDFLSTISGDGSANGGEGIDYIELYGLNGNGVVVNLALGQAHEVGYSSDTTSVTNIENIMGSWADDLLTGNSGNNIIAGHTGSDTINGGDGIDTVDYRNLLSYNSASVTINLATGVATDATDFSTDTLVSIENVIGGVSNDSITGNSGANSLYGMEGNDTLEGGLGNDTLDGGDGKDIARYTNAASAVIVNLATGTATGADDSDTLSGIEDVIGSGYADTITGNTQNNTLEAGAGNDIIYSAGGSDTVLGGDGDDEIYLGAGEQTLTGGDGVDTYIVQADAEQITITDFDVANDILDLRAFTAIGSYAELTKAASGADSLITIGDIEILLEGVNFATELPTINYLFYGNIVIDGTSGGDTLSGGSGNETINGFEGNDTITGGDGDDILIGGTGNDSLNGGDGFDTADYSTATAAVAVSLLAGSASGGAGTDTLASIEKVFGSTYGDTLTGSASGDTLYGNAGNDILNGGNGADTLYGDAGNDSVRGDAGNDTLYGGEGNDNLTGGDGDDTLINEVGNDDMSGGAGVDSVISSVNSAGYIVYRTHADYLLLHNTASAEVDRIYNDVESLVFNDVTLDLTAMTFVLNGEGWGTPVTVYGTSSAQTINGYNVADTIHGGGGNDTINGNLGNDILYGDDGNDSVRGNAGNDTLYGGDGNDNLNGGDGDDTLVNESGNDDISGGNGLDSAIYNVNSAGYIVYRGHNNYLTVRNTANAETDQIYNDVESIVFNDVTLDLTTMSFVLNGEGWGTAVPITGTSSGETLAGNHGIDNIYGEGGNDTIDGNGGTDTLYGGDGNDLIRGGSEDDLIYGDAGSDNLYGNTGNDTLYGGAGDDNMNGHDGDDILVGGDGNDTIRGDAGTDTLLFQNSSSGFIVYRSQADYLTVRNTNTGEQDTVYNSMEAIQFSDVTLDLTTMTFSTTGPGWGTALPLMGTENGETLNGTHAIDTIYGGGGNDTINGSYGDDTLYGGDGNDVLYGSNDNDVLYGDAGADTLYGNVGSDTLRGGADADSLQGQDGDDILEGNIGADTLNGGAGADRYVFKAGDVGTGSDTISGFSLTDGDILDLADILGGVYDPLTDAITDFIEITTSGSHSILKVDVDGGANNFVQIAQISNVTGLTDEEALVTSENLLVA